jgi:ribosomal protein S27AE
MPQCEIGPSQIGEDWEGNNIAITCPACGKVFIVSGLIHKGRRACPKCGKSTGVLKRR